LNKFRDFQRSYANYKRQLQKLQAEQRRAEWEARKKEEDQPVDADVPSDDPLVGHPWAHEILQCSDLEKMLISLLPREVKVDVQEKEAEKAWLHGAAGKMSGKQDADPFAGLAVKKSKGAKKAAASRLVLTMDTVAGLAAAGVPIPTTASDIPACLSTVSSTCCSACAAHPDLVFWYERSVIGLVQQLSYVLSSLEFVLEFV
jgi:hypothetical protein